MKYNFDEIIDRVGTGSSKWENVGVRTGNPDGLPMWTADMDFPCPEPVVNAVVERAKHPIYGYPYVSQDFRDASAQWIEKQHGWRLEPDWIVFVTGVCPVINTMILALTEPGDKVILSCPVYHSFANAIRDTGRELSDNSLIYQDGRYTIDYDDLRRRAADPKAKLMVVCNPHNPVGRVWTEEELYRVSEICAENHVVVVSDEIHSDLMLYAHKHVPMGQVGTEKMKNNIISCFAPSKTFNCAGLRTSSIVVPDPGLRSVLTKELAATHAVSQTVFAIPALVAAYTKCDDYLEQLLAYLEQNMDFVRNYLNEKMPRMRLVEPEATFLAWIDCSGLGMTGEELAKFIIFDCNVSVSRGDSFGPEGAQFIRMNVGCPRSTVEKGLNRIYEQYRRRF